MKYSYKINILLKTVIPNILHKFQRTKSKLFHIPELYSLRIVRVCY